ncbi:hypothetical protein BT93_L3743 [Corymbia citriodora subsp. variegata]|uniref:Bet v I/Major latex protein domain-containing protein n=1 Tax=Corymbia citriodora subsp. variegata TaxID=360336 RepID=A0A8T0CV73_CORYI|nr:hypothetical protein BT93_L3743 [Corymbia citriodora subsp. variegata]
MCVVTCETEITTSIPPAVVFRAFVLQDNLIPKLFPQAIKNVVSVEGDGASQFFNLLTYAYTIIEGDAWVNVLKKILQEIKFETGLDGRRGCKSTSRYCTKEGAETKEEQPDRGRQREEGEGNIQGH